MVLLAEGIAPECMVGTFHSHGWVALVVMAGGLAGAVYSLARGFAWLREEADCGRAGQRPPDRHVAKSWLLGLWVLLPPMWLYVEDIFLFRHFGKAACFESFRHAQQIVGGGWIVVVAVLTVLYFGRQIFARD